MKTIEFKEWLRDEGYNEDTINSRVSNCLRVCKSEDDLDEQYSKDRCAGILDRLTYSTSDEKLHLPPKHNIQIDGNIRNGTATLKQAVNLYVKFLTANKPLSKPASHHTSTELDSYFLFLDYFSIEKSSFYSFGLETTIFADAKVIKPDWERIKQRLITNQSLSIREYGRNGKNTILYLEMYKFIFNNSNIQRDPTNNTKPKQNLQALTGHQNNKTLVNYQCSHIFGCTKNPLLFETCWNICFVPKIFDPLTGHESKGIWPKEYQKLFIEMAYSKYRSLIEDYNTFVHENDIHKKINDFVDSVKDEYDTKTLYKFRQDALQEWKFIHF